MKWIIQYSVLAVILLVVAGQFDVYDTRYGLDVDHPGASCDDIYKHNPYSHGKSGHYLVKADDLFLTKCEMKKEEKDEEKDDYRSQWITIAEIDVNKGDDCPEGWVNDTMNGVEFCRAPTNDHGCFSAVFPVNTSYHKVRGFVRGYQKGSPDSFDLRNGVWSINEAYVDGVSITMGSPRKHLWTYVAGISDDFNYRTSTCPCAAVPGPSPPAFVGEHYYCESGNIGAFEFNTHYTDDPLWDGAGCYDSKNNCCTNADLPWFQREFVLLQYGDIEVRICYDQPYRDEAIVVDQVKLFVK